MILYTQKHHLPFLIDESDLEAVSHYTWYVDSHGYPATTTGKWPDRHKTFLHRFLLGQAPAGLEIDHKNRDKTDNRRANLRFVTSTVNKRNTGLLARNSSGVRGVGFDRKRGKWRALIRIPGRKTYLGRFDSLQDAIAARIESEKQLWKGDR